MCGVYHLTLKQQFTRRRPLVHQHCSVWAELEFCGRSLTGWFYDTKNDGIANIIVLCLCVAKMNNGSLYTWYLGFSRSTLLRCMVNSRFVMNDDIKFTLQLRTQAETRTRAMKNVTWLVNSEIQSKIKHYASWEQNDVRWNLSHRLAFLRLSAHLPQKKQTIYRLGRISSPWETTVPSI